jgi:2-amino-4-hydroxy-6-hydroxymethyldihydropteridine diphosphokinase
MDILEHVYLSLGSNLGDRKKNILDALDELKQVKNIYISGLSSFYETEPYGNKDQPAFINIIVKVKTDIDPYELLNVCKKIEKKIGRVERGRWREREIDIDIIFYNSKIIVNEVLSIPHKEYQNRKFVLEPLNEIAPEFVCPLSGESIKNILNNCKDTSLIKLLN